VGRLHVVGADKVSEIYIRPTLHYNTPMPHLSPGPWSVELCWA